MIYGKYDRFVKRLLAAEESGCFKAINCQQKRFKQPGSGGKVKGYGVNSTTLFRAIPADRIT